MRRIAKLLLAVGCVSGGVANASIATFDSFAEGDLGTSFTDGGITFFGFDDRAGGTGHFTAERADGTLSGAGFSAPNALGFGGWSPGQFAAFGQCGSFSFTTGVVQSFASVEVFEFFSYGGNTIALEAYLGGALVNSTSITLPGNLQINHFSLSVSGAAFDTLRVTGGGPTDRGVFFGLVDNVVVVPAPGSALLLLGVCAVRRRR